MSVGVVGAEEKPTSMVEVDDDRKSGDNVVIGRQFCWQKDADPCFSLDIDSEVLGDRGVAGINIKVCLDRREFESASDNVVRTDGYVEVSVGVKL